MAAGRSETKPTEIERKQERQREYKALISELESFKKTFNILQKGEGESPGFNVLKQRMISIGNTFFDDSRHFNIKDEWSDLLDKMRDSERHEYNFYDLNLHWIIKNDRKNLDVLINGLIHIHAHPGPFEGIDKLSERISKTNRCNDVCFFASRIIDEINHLIAKVEKHTADPDVSLDTLLSNTQKFLMAGYLGMAFLFTVTGLQEWRPGMSVGEEMDMLKTYLKDVAERLEKIRHSVETYTCFLEKDYAERMNGISMFSRERKEGVAAAPLPEEKKSILNRP